MATYTIVLTEAEELAMTHAAMDVNGWIQNAIHERARIAIDEIVQLAVQKFLENNQSIPGSKDAIVAAAFANGWVKSATDRNMEP